MEKYKVPGVSVSLIGDGEIARARALIPSHGPIAEMVARARFELASEGPKPSILVH